MHNKEQSIKVSGYNSIFVKKNFDSGFYTSWQLRCVAHFNTKALGNNGKIPEFEIGIAKKFVCAIRS